MIKIPVFCMLLILPNFLAYSQVNKLFFTTDKANVTPIESGNTNFLSMTHADIKKNGLPYFLERYVVKTISPSFKLINTIVRELNEAELKIIEPYKSFITHEFDISSSLGKSREETILYQKIIPLRLNSQTNKYEFLESYSPTWDQTSGSNSTTFAKIQKNARVSATNTSVLSTGKWYKVGLTKDGVYKMNKSFLVSLGIDVDAIDPRTIRVYGNGGKLLPEKNSIFRHDDLQENAIAVHGENDGVFHDTDYVMFYGQSTDSWKHINGSNMPFDHQIHYFSDTSFYFITTDLGAGKRISSQSSLPNSPNTITSKQDYYGFHEQNTGNIVKSGREFYGEKFDLTTSYSFSFLIPDAAIGDSVYVKAGALGRSDLSVGSSHFAVSFNSGSFNFSCDSTNINYYLVDVGHVGSNSKGGLLSSSYLSVSVTKLTAQATAWLDNVVYNARRHLIFSQSQFDFRDRKTVLGANTFAKYILTNNNSNLPTIWDVTNTFDIKEQQYNISSSTLDFTASSDSLKTIFYFHK